MYYKHWSTNNPSTFLLADRPLDSYIEIDEGGLYANIRSQDIMR